MITISQRAGMTAQSGLHVYSQNSSWLMSENGNQGSIKDTLIAMLGEYGDDYDLDAIIDDWTSQVQHQVLDAHGLTLAGDELIGDNRSGVDGETLGPEARQVVNIWDVIANHDKENDD